MGATNYPPLAFVDTAPTAVTVQFVTIQIVTNHKSNYWGFPMSRVIQCLAFLATATIAASANAENIIDEHIKAVGGADAIAKVKTVERSGNVSLTGPFGAFQGSLTEEFDVAGSKGHRVMDLGIFRIESGWAGDTGWQDVPQQGLKDMSEDELGFAKINGSASVVASIKQQYGLAAFNEPTDEKFNEQDCAKVTVKETPLELFFNKETKLLEGISVKDLTTTTFEDYEEVEGIQFAKKGTTKILQGDITIVNEYEETKLNGELDDTVFAKPEVAEPAAAEPEVAEPAAAE